MGNSNHKNAKITKELIDTHNETTAKSRVKLLVFGCNTGKSMWFHHTKSPNSAAVIGITFRVQTFNIGPKLPEVNAILYDTAESISFFQTTLTYIPDANGLILTYNTDCRDTLNHLKQCIDSILERKSKRCPILLLGIQESIGLTKTNCVNEAHQFAIDYNLFHLELDINCKQDLCSDEPYIYLLRTILNQKQIVSSPLMEQTFDFNEEMTHKMPWNEVPPELRELGIPQLLSKDTDYDAMVRLTGMQNGINVNVEDHDHDIDADNDDDGDDLDIDVGSDSDSIVTDMKSQDENQSDFPFRELVVSPRKRSRANAHLPRLSDIKSVPCLPGLEVKPLFPPAPLLRNSSEPMLPMFNRQIPISFDEQKEINHFKAESDDMICRSEFIRFIDDELGKDRSDRYLEQFQSAKLNDIRILHTVHPLNKQWFEDNPLGMDPLDKRLLQRAVMKYVLDFTKFKTLLDGMGMTSRYHRQMINRGIATFWGYSYHIKSVHDLHAVVDSMDEQDAEVIFVIMQESMEGKDGRDIHAMKEGAWRQSRCSQMEGVEGQQQNSDSEEMYVNGDDIIVDHHDDEVMERESDSEQMYDNGDEVLLPPDGHISHFNTTSNTTNITNTSGYTGTVSPGSTPPPPPFFIH